MAKNAPTRSRQRRRDRLHGLVDALPDSELSTAIRVLEGLRAAAQQQEVESLTPEEEAAEEKAWREYAEGRDPGVPLEEVKRRLAAEPRA